MTSEDDELGAEGPDGLEGLAAEVGDPYVHALGSEGPWKAGR